MMRSGKLVNSGFTFIELMIVVAIVGILAAIAYPSYLDYVRKSRRADGQQALLRVQLEQEKWRANNSSYSSNLTNLGLTSSSGDGNYTISLSSVTATGYTVQATATGAQASDTSCSPLSLAVSTTGETRGPSGCWNK